MRGNKKKLIYLVIVAVAVIGAIFAWPIVGDFISGVLEGGIDVNLNSIPIIGGKPDEPPSGSPEQITETPVTPGVTVQKVEEGPVEAPPPVQPPTAPAPEGQKDIVDSVVNTSVKIFDGGQTIIQEVGQTGQVVEDVAGFPICTGTAILVFGGLVVKLVVALLKKLYEGAEDLFTSKVLTSMFIMLAIAGLLLFQTYHSYKIQGLSYVNSAVRSVAPWAILMVVWDQLFHKGIWEKIRFEIGGIRPLILISRAVEILLSGMYAIGGGLGLMVNIGQGIAKVPAVGSLISQPIISIAQSQTQVQTAASAQSWFQSTAATDALLGLLAILVITFIVMTGGFYEGMRPPTNT